MNQITSIRNGSLVSNLNGKESGNELLLPVSGVAQEGADVFVNGVEAERDGLSFIANVPIKDKIATITMATSNEYGDFTQTLKVLWDKASYPRYNFFIDDNIFFLTDIAEQRPKSLFDHFYLGFLKRMHDTYGAKFTLNMFYENAHHPFKLSQFPDCYKSEFQANRDWLRLSWHAYAEFPDRPYQNATVQKFSDDIKLIRSEIARFAGEECYLPPIANHWSMIRPEAYSVLRENGVKVLCGQFMNPKTSLSEKRGSYMCDIGYFRNLNDCLYLAKRQVLQDFDEDITYLHSLLICNYFTPQQIVDIMRKAAASPDYCNLLSLETHEQYSFPYYFNYIPDHLDRIETSIRTATELGYKPVFFAEGLLGNTAWD